MAVVEILGDKMHKVFKEYGINYTKTYSKRCNKKCITYSVKCRFICSRN